MFVGRKNELDSLNKSYIKDSFQFPVVYGRRRAGGQSDKTRRYNADWC